MHDFLIINPCPPPAPEMVDLFTLIPLRTMELTFGINIARGSTWLWHRGWTLRAALAAIQCEPGVGHIDWVYLRRVLAGRITDPYVLAAVAGLPNRAEAIAA